MRGRLIGAVAVAVAVTTLAACGGSEPKTETVTAPTSSAESTSTTTTSSRPDMAETNGKVGSTLTSTDETVDPAQSVEIKLASYDRDATPDDPGLASSLLESDSKSASDYQWVRLEVTAKNVGQDKMTLLGPDFTAVASNGDRYKGEDVDPGGVFEPDADAEHLQPGDRVHGFIAIAVPTSARISRIRYANLGGEGTVEWKVGS